MPDATPDVHAIVAEIEAEVAQRRAAGEYTEELLRGLRITVDPAALDPPALLAHVDRVRTPISRRPLVGPAIVFGKRVLRRSIAWYVQPFAGDQTRFNLAVARDLRRVERLVGHLRVDWTAFDSLAEEDVADGREAVRAAFVAAVAESSSPTLVCGLPLSLVEDIIAALPSHEILRSTDPFDTLDGTPPQSLGGAVLVGLVPRMSRTEVLNVVPLLARALRPGASLVIDAVVQQSTPAGDTRRDPSLQQPLPAAELRQLVNAFGFELVSRAEASPAWHVLRLVRTPE